MIVEILAASAAVTLFGVARYVEGRQRARRRAEILEEPDVAWNATHGRAMTFDRPWLRINAPDLRLNAFVGSVTLTEEVRDDRGVVLVPEDVRDLVGVTWPDEGATEGLRRRVSSLDPRLQPLADRLLAIDDYHPPGGHGFCHAAVGEGIDNASDIVQAFVDLVWMGVGQPGNVLHSFVKRAANPQWQDGVDASLLFRLLPAEKRVVDLARRFVNSSDPAVALRAAEVIGVEAIPRIRSIAVEPSNTESLRTRAFEVAWKLAPEDRESLLLRLFAPTAPYPPIAVFPRASAVATDRLGRALAEYGTEHWDGLPNDRRVALLDQLGSFGDADTGAFVVARLGGSDEALVSAARAVKKRGLSEATPTLVQLLASDDAAMAIPLAVDLLGDVGTLEAVVALREVEARLGRRIRPLVEVAVLRIQERHGGGAVGGLALSVAEGGGELSVAEDASGRLSEPEP